MKHVFRLIGIAAVAAVLGGCAAVEPAPVPATSFAVVQMSDPQLGFSGDFAADRELLANAVRCVNALDPAPAMVLVTGDLVNVNTDDAWRDFRMEMEKLSIPWACVPGNHDIGIDDQSAVRERFQTLIGPDYQTLEYGGYRFLLVNTQFWQQEPDDATAAMDRWFRNELAMARAAGEPVVVVGHVPLFVREVNEPDAYFNIPLARRLELLALFREFGVVAVLSGHTHTAFTTVYQGMVFSSGENTSGQFDRLAPGFRVLEWNDGSIPIRTMPLEKP